MTSSNDPFAPPPREGSPPGAQAEPGQAAGGSLPLGQPLPGGQAPYGQPYGGQAPYGGQPYGGQPGGQPYGYAPYGAPSSQRQNGFGVAALVLGIASIIPGFLYIGVVLGPLAVIFGILGRKRVRRGQADNGGMALTGVITGVVGTLVAAGVIVLVVAFINSGSTQTYRHCLEQATSQQQRQACADQFGHALTGT